MYGNYMTDLRLKLEQKMKKEIMDMEDAEIMSILGQKPVLRCRGITHIAYGLPIDQCDNIDCIMEKIHNE